MNPFSKQGAATGKKCNSAMSIDVFGQKSNRNYHETKVIECFREIVFHFVLKCMTCLSDISTTASSISRDAIL